MKLFTAIVSNPHGPDPRLFCATTDDALFGDIADFYDGEWDPDEYATVHDYVEDLGLTLDTRTLQPAAPTPPQCARHGGTWGNDATCKHCTGDDGNVRDLHTPGPLGDDGSTVPPLPDAILNGLQSVLWAAFADVRSSFVLALAEHLPPETITAVDTTVGEYLGNHYC